MYGSLRSTWPVGSGVLVEDGVVYAAAGLANHDGTHVYALDAVTSQLRWHNGNSGSLHPQTASGVSVNGCLLLHNQQLHLAMITKPRDDAAVARRIETRDQQSSSFHKRSFEIHRLA